MIYVIIVYTYYKREGEAKKIKGRFYCYLFFIVHGERKKVQQRNKTK